MYALNGVGADAVRQRTVTRGWFKPGDAGIRQTMERMRALATEGAKDVAVRETALGIVRRVPDHAHRAELDALFRFVRDRIAFRNDIHGVETLQSPRYTLEVAAGDCDDRATLLVALARSIGIPAEFRYRVVAADPRSKAFSHVYAVARLDGEDIPLDPTYRGNRMGWEPGGSRHEDSAPMSLGVLPFRSNRPAFDIGAPIRTRPTAPSKIALAVVRSPQVTPQAPTLVPIPPGLQTVAANPNAPSINSGVLPARAVASVWDTPASSNLTPVPAAQVASATPTEPAGDAKPFPWILVGVALVGAFVLFNAFKKRRK